jgi:hypothetical protein
MKSNIVVANDEGLFNVAVVVALPTIHMDHPQLYVHGKMEVPLGSGKVLDRLLLLCSGFAYDVSDERSEPEYLGQVVR